MIRRVCFRIPFLPFLWEMPSIHSRPEAWGPWEGQYAPPILHCACIMPIPSLQLQKKACLMQRSRGFGHGVVVSKICYNTVIVLSVVLRECCEPTNTCQDWAFSNSGLDMGLPAFQLPMFAKCDALPKGDLFHMFVWGIHSCHSFGKCQAFLSKEFMPSVKSKCPLPTRSLTLLRAAVRSTSCALCLYYACKRSHSFVEDSGFVSWLSF